MEEDPLIPLVHVCNNAAFDNASSSMWHAHSPAPASARRGKEGDKENHRPEREEPDVEAEIGLIEAEILRLSSRLHHLRTSKQQPEPPKRVEVAPASALTVTTIHSLGDDLLREIFLRLPSLPSLVHAALTCRTFLAAVRSSPAFRRRFRALHPPPLLGFFFGSSGTDLPSFSPIRRRSDPDIAAAVRGADVFLTRVPYHKDVFPGLQILDCRGGCLLLVNWWTNQIAVYNPLTRALDFVPMPPYETSSGRNDNIYNLNHDHFYLLYSDQSPDPFRVVRPCHDKSKVRASVFSSDTREWQILPWSETAPGALSLLLIGTQVNENLYWADPGQAYTVVLDALTLQVSFIDLPGHLKGQGHPCKLGEAKDGKLCMVTVSAFTLHTWFPGADHSGGEKWMLHSVIPLEGEILEATKIPEDELSGHSLTVWAVLDGIVYMSIDEEENCPSWVLSLCLETRKLEFFFQRLVDCGVMPYIMGWPSFLIGNDTDMVLTSGA